MKTVKNELTGQNEVVFSAELIAPLSENVLQNSNGKNFRIASIKFLDKFGKEQKSTAMIYEGNYQHGLTVGESYLATVSKGEANKAYIRLSHIPYVDAQATADMFDFAGEEVKATSKVKASIESKMD